MSVIDYLRIFADAEGVSHMETLKIELESNDYAPPAPALNLSAASASSKSLFLELPVGWYGDWHPTPVQQWLVIMSGECEFEVEDGEKCMRKTGDVVRLDDTIGKGHQTRVIGEQPVLMTAVHLV